MLSPSTLEDFQAALDSLVQSCAAFKFAKPHVVPPTVMSRADLRRAATVTEEGRSLPELVSRLSEVVFPACLNFSAPTFFGHPDAGNSTAGILGDIANAFLHQNLSSFDYSPAATVVETALLQTLRQVVGYPTALADNASSPGGGVVFGGSGANFSCLLAAREHLKRTHTEQGRVFDPRRTRVLANRPFTHFSLRRSLHMLGLGNRDLTPEQRQELGLAEESLHELATSGFRVDADDLERQIEVVRARGEDILCVFAVAGDSRFMAFDDLRRITEITRRHHLWLHVDACEGGQVLFSPNRRHLMDGVEQADSISLDPHKVLLVPYNVSLFFLRDASWLRYFSGDPATVINQDEDSLGGFTPTINSKSFISLKLLLMLQHWGWKRIADEIDRRHQLAKAAAEWIEAEPRLRLINPGVDHNAVAFMYADPDRPMSPDELNSLNKAIHQRINMGTDYFVHAFPARDDEARVRTDKGTIYPMRMMFGNPLSTWELVQECLEAVLKAGSCAWTSATTSCSRSASPTTSTTRTTSPSPWP